MTNKHRVDDDALVMRRLIDQRNSLSIAPTHLIDPCMCIFKGLNSVLTVPSQTNQWSSWLRAPPSTLLINFPIGRDGQGRWKVAITMVISSQAQDRVKYSVGGGNWISTLNNYHVIVRICPVIELKPRYNSFGTDMCLAWKTRDGYVPDGSGDGGGGGGGKLWGVGRDKGSRQSI